MPVFAQAWHSEPKTHGGDVVEPGARRQQLDQFEAVSDFLRQRGSLRSTQRVMAVVNVSAASVPVNVLIFEPKAAPWAPMASVLTGFLTLGTAIFWLSTWPSRRQSAALVIAGVCCITGWTLAQPSAIIAVLGCAAASVTGAYMGFFHGARLLLLNSFMAAVMTSVALVRLVDTTDVATALAAFWVIAFLNVSVPLGTYGLSRAMCTYAQRSDEDPLTGLLNRRGFTDVIRHRLIRDDLGHAQVAILMIDLDDFKRINDTRGHAAGDAALQDLARLLQASLPATAVISRAGGEEFLIAVTLEAPDVIGPLASELCAAVARMPHGITASVGTAVTEVRLLRDSSDVVQLIDTADMAMYTAKHRGGNRVHHG